MRTPLDVLRAAIGKPAGGQPDHLEKWLSGIGGLLGVLGVMLVSQRSLGLSGSASLVASMGASAVLLFAVPHGPLSQPWPVFGGHMVSAVIGVACASVIAEPFLGAGLAVALAIGAMHYLRCIHPPGGATALTAAAGGDAVHALGFQYVLTPVLLNVLLILCVAVLFNLPFAWRRYPAAWARSARPTATAGGNGPDTRPAVAAPQVGPGRADDSGLDQPPVSPHMSPALRPEDIRAGGCYCNGAFGPTWQVRQVLDCGSVRSRAPDARATVSYRVAAGVGRRRTGTATLGAFAAWARYEVALNENSWQRLNTAGRAAAGDAPEPLQLEACT